MANHQCAPMLFAISTSMTAFILFAFLLKKKLHIISSQRKNIIASSIANIVCHDIHGYHCPTNNVVCHQDQHEGVYMLCTLGESLFRAAPDIILLLAPQRKTHGARVGQEQIATDGLTTTTE